MTEAQYTVIREWIEKYTNLQVRPANINKSRPEYPFAVLNIIADTQLGVDEICTELNSGGDALDLAVVGHRRFTTSVQIHSRFQHPEENGRYYLSKLRTSFRLPSVVEAFKLAGLATVRTMPLQNIDRQIEGRWESLWNMDVQFATAESLTESIPFIETVKVTDQISVPDNSFTIP